MISEESVACEGDPAGDHVVESGAEAVDIGSAVDVDLAADLLGGDIVRRAVGLALFALGGLDIGRLAGQTHIGQLHDALRVDHDVLGLDVAVDQAVGVGVLEGVADLDDDLDGFLLAEDVPVGDVVGDGLALDVLHDEIVVAARLADVDGLDDVRVVELAGGLPFLVEPLHVLGILAESTRQDLDRDAAVEAELLALIDDGHRAGAELAEDLVPGDLRGGGLALFDARFESLRLAGREVAKLDHEILEHQRIDLAAFFVFLDGSAQFLIRAEPLIHRHPSEQRVVRGLGTHSNPPGHPRGCILSLRSQTTSAPVEKTDRTYRRRDGHYRVIGAEVKPFFHHSSRQGHPTVPSFGEFSAGD